MSGKMTSQPSDWIATYGDSLLNYALVRVSDREAARDLVQETFLSALRARESFRGESSEKTWMFSIMKNKIVDYYRKSALEKGGPQPGHENSFDPAHYFDTEGEWRANAQPVGWTGPQDESYRSKEFYDTLMKCLEHLTPQRRAIFMMKYLDDLDSEEICKELQISPSNYWVIIHRAKLVLRECIEKNWILA
jgi:RNA polymerase sigma-70 factor (TIGR02943 family)